MIFTAHEAYLIRTGRKTQHRVLLHRAYRTRVGADIQVQVERKRPEEELYGFSSTIVATGGRRTRPPVELVAEGRITILDRRAQLIGDMTPDDAKAEGFKSVEAFVHAWAGFDFDAAPSRGRSVVAWIDAAGAALEQFVVVLEFEADRKDHPRYLAPAARPDRWGIGGDHGYTDKPSRALPGEPEAVNPAELDQAWTVAARGRRVNARGDRELQDRRRQAAARIRREATPEQLDRIADVLAEEGEAA